MAPLIAEVVMQRQEWLVHLTRCARADARKMFDSQGNPLPITQLGPNEATSIAGFDFYEEFSCRGENRIAVGVTKKFKLIDPLRALELLGKACHYYADRQEHTDPDGRPIAENLTVSFVDAATSPEEAYRRMVGGS